MSEQLAVVAFAAATDWEAWLDAEHLTSPGVWLRIARKASGTATVTYSEAVEVALCFGWIDGQKGHGDEMAWLQRFTPRRPGGRWSVVNRAKAVELIAAGRMRPAGLREVDAARADGRWDAAYAGQATAEIPEDLRAALAAAGLLDVFAGLKSSERYSILYRVQDAKRPDTRSRRVTAFVDMLGRGETPHGLIS
jgi:uncharacterized protein YdeI (YjbR/CyaY-like superfamily)